MWELYKILKTDDVQEHFLIDEIFSMLDRISKEDFLQALLMMYPKIDFKKYNPVEMATLFIAGLKKNDFFSFIDTVKVFNGNPIRR